MDRGARADFPTGTVSLDPRQAIGNGEPGIRHLGGNRGRPGRVGHGGEDEEQEGLHRSVTAAMAPKPKTADWMDRRKASVGEWLTVAR